LDERATLNDFDWRFNPKLPRQACFEMHTLKFITEGSNALIIGKTGTGKSHSRQGRRLPGDAAKLQSALPPKPTPSSRNSRWPALMNKRCSLANTSNPVSADPNLLFFSRFERACSSSLVFF